MAAPSAQLHGIEYPGAQPFSTRWPDLGCTNLWGLSRAEVGRIGEDIAVARLQARHWRLLARNLRVGRDELDALFTQGSRLNVVEVKTRRGSGFGWGRDALSATKIHHLRRATSRWLSQQPQGFSEVSFYCAEVSVVAARTVHFELVEVA